MKMFEKGAAASKPTTWFNPCLGMPADIHFFHDPIFKLSFKDSVDLITVFDDV